MLLEVIQYLLPNAECSYTGDPSTAEQYAQQVTWLDARPQPSWLEIQAARSTFEHAKAQNEVRQLRHSAYIAESDPLFFGWQRGENTEVVWLAKVQEIRNRYPEPTDA